METIWLISQVIGAVVVVGLIILKIYLISIKGICTSTVSLAGKITIVTGANTGIGFYTALDFAKRNARVILACRDIVKGEDAANKIIELTGNKNVVVMQCDLSKMKSVREFAAKINSKEPRLDILVNNAGMAGLPLTMTDEGFEVMWASNHFGHFLLTNLLLDLLKKSKPSRIVNVSSVAHTWSKGIDLDNMRAEKGEKHFSISGVYFASKLANILFTRELAERLKESDVTSYSVHPGIVSTEVWRNQRFQRAFFVYMLKFFMKSPEEGAQTTIYCSVSEEVEKDSGKYFMDCKEADNKSSILSKDMGLAKKLWEKSEQLTGLA
ncbi:Dehydrogenase reductase SDR member 13 [Mactra antiquata]